MPSLSSPCLPLRLYHLSSTLPCLRDSGMVMWVHAMRSSMEKALWRRRGRCPRHQGRGRPIPAVAPSWARLEFPSHRWNRAPTCTNTPSMRPLRQHGLHNRLSTILPSLHQDGPGPGLGLELGKVRVLGCCPPPVPIQGHWLLLPSPRGSILAPPAATSQAPERPGSRLERTRGLPPTAASVLPRHSSLF